MPISWIPSKSILESKIKAEQSALDWLQNPEKYDWLNNQPSPETPPPETPPKKFQPPTWATQPQQQPDLGKTLSSWIAGSMREAAQRGAAPQDVITAPIKPLITGQLPPSYQRPPTTEERSQGQYAYQPTWAGQQAYEQWQPPGVKLPGTENPVLGALSGMVGAQPFQGGGTELNVKSALEMAPWLAIPGGFRGSAGVAEKVAGKAKPAIQEMLASERGSIGKIPKEIPKIEQPPIKPPIEPPISQLTPDESIRSFWKAASSPEASSQWNVQEMARTAERGKRSGVFNDRLVELLKQGTEPENALNQVKKEALIGKLPSAATTIGDLITPEVRSTMFSKIQEKLTGQSYEITATSKALENALAGKPIPRTPGTQGGSAYSRLEKVFGDSPEFMKAIENPDELLSKMHDPRPPTWPDFPNETVIKQLQMIPNNVRPEIVDMLGKQGVKLANILNIPRALTTSFDASIIFRQNLLLGTRFPKQGVQQWRTVFKALKSEKFATEYDNALRTDPDVMVGVAKYKLELPSIAKGTPLANRPEEYMSTLVEKLPGIRASERSFVVPGNGLRASVWKSQYNSMKKLGATEEDYAAMAKLINALSGRAELRGNLLKYSPLLNATFFAPRYVISRLQLPTMLFSKSPATRKLAWQTLATFLSFGATTLGIYKTLGGEIEYDPRSSDFAKVKIGNTRVDVWGGFIQYARFAAQLVSNERKTETEKEQGLNRKETLIRFLQSKASPIASLVTDLLAGTTYTGQKLSADAETLKEQLISRLAPMSAQDLYDAIRYNDSPETKAVGGLSGIGLGVTSYKPNEVKTGGGGKIDYNSLYKQTYESKIDYNKLYKR